MSGWSVTIPRRILNADYALPVGHLPRGTYPPSKATNPALATPLWTAKPSQRRETYPRHGSLRPAGDGGQYTLPEELSIYSPPGSLLPVISLRYPAVLISHYYCRYYLKSLCPNYVRVDFQSRCNWVPVFYKESDCLSDLHNPVTRSTQHPLVKQVRLTGFWLPITTAKNVQWQPEPTV